MDRSFEEAHAAWLASHKRRRNGERLRRLAEGHRYLEKLLLEKVWWPAFHSLEDVHPEYEVRDYKDGYCYLDAAFRPGSARIALEADGFGPHVRDVGRDRHADLLMRDASLTAEGWTVLHVSTDIIERRPRQMQGLLQQIVYGRIGRDGGLQLSPAEKEAIRFARQKGRPITPKELCAALGRCHNTTREMITRLMERKLLAPAPGTKARLRAFEVTKLGRDTLI